MNRRDLPIALKIARTALEKQDCSNRIAYELGLSEAELDRIYSEIEKTLALPYYQPLKGDK
jgi:hypothetical protein